MSGTLVHCVKVSKFICIDVICEKSCVSVKQAEFNLVYRRLVSIRTFCIMNSITLELCVVVKS